MPCCDELRREVAAEEATRAGDRDLGHAVSLSTLVVFRGDRGGFLDVTRSVWRARLAASARRDSASSAKPVADSVVMRVSLIACSLLATSSAFAQPAPAAPPAAP